MKTGPSAGLGALAPLVLLLSCDTDRRAVPFELRAHAFDHSEWSEPVNMGAPVNSAFTEFESTMTTDGLTLYLQSDRPGGLGGNDLWVSHRPSLDSPWEDPVNLGAVINSAAAESGPSLSTDGHLLFFQSTRPGGLGDRDIYVSRRANPTDDFGWGPPENLGPDVNTATSELSPEYVSSAAGGPAQLYFQRGLQVGNQSDIYYAVVTRNGEPLGPAELVAELSVPNANDASPAVRADGREIFFSSNRFGGGGGLFVSTRRSPHDPWSPPVSLGGSLSVQANGPDLSRDGRTLLFFSTRPGGLGGSDIWITTRTTSRQ